MGVFFEVGFSVPSKMPLPQEECGRLVFFLEQQTQPPRSVSYEAEGAARYRFQVGPHA